MTTPVAAGDGSPQPGEIWKASDGRRLQVVAITLDGRVSVRNVETNRLSYLQRRYFEGAREGHWSIEREEVGEAAARSPRPTQNAAGLTSSCPDGHGLMTYHPDDGTPGGEYWECPVCRMQCMWPDTPKSAAARSPRLEPVCVACRDGQHQQCLGGACACIHAEEAPRPEAPDDLLRRLHALSKKWAGEADAIDQDGDFCCAQTRRNDAGELFDVLRKHAAVRSPRLEPPSLDPQDVLALASRLESTFDPGGHLPEDCAAWAAAHAEVIHELRGLAECALMDDDEDDSPPDTVASAPRLEPICVACREDQHQLCLGGVCACIHAEAARAPREPLEPILAQLRHAYQQLVAHDNRWSRRGMREFADGLIAPQIRKLEALAAEDPMEVAREFAEAGAEVHFISTEGVMPFVEGSRTDSGTSSAQVDAGVTHPAENTLAAARSALPPPRVGCERADGLLNVHPESETCEVCQPAAALPRAPEPEQ